MSLEPHAVLFVIAAAMAELAPGQWSTAPPAKAVIAKLGKSLGDGGYMEADVADAKVQGLRHLILLRASAAGRVNAEGRTVTALTCSADSVSAVAMLKRLKPSFHICSVGPGRCKVLDKKLLHVRRFRVLTPSVFAARLAAATAEKLHLCRPIDAGIAGSKSSRDTDDDTAEDYDDDAATSGAESVDVGGRVSPSAIASGAAKAKAAKAKAAALADAKAKAKSSGTGAGTTGSAALPTVQLTSLKLPSLA